MLEESRCPKCKQNNGYTTQGHGGRMCDTCREAYESDQEQRHEERMDRRRWEDENGG